MRTRSLERFLDKIICGLDLDVLRQLPDKCVQAFVTSPPYWGLRNYGFAGQRGLEKTPEEYVAGMVEVFREGRRVLKDDGTLWLNMGDSYCQGNKGNSGEFRPHDKQATNIGSHATRRGAALGPNRRQNIAGLKPKDLVGLPWMLAFALRADGWYLRRDIIWSKGNCMPESVKDRPTTSHEYLFLLSKSQRYYYDADAIKEPCSADTHARYARGRSDNHKYADGGPGDQTIAKTLDHMARKPVNWHNSPEYQGQHPDKPALPDSYHDAVPGGSRRLDRSPGWRKNLPAVTSKSRTTENGACACGGKEPERDAQGLRVGSRFGRAPGWRKNLPGVTPKSADAGSGIRANESFHAATCAPAEFRNKRSVWHINSVGYKGAHFATFPPKLIEPCILAGSRPGDVVLDPYGGSGTTAQVASSLNRHFILIDGKQEYCDMAQERIQTLSRKV